MKADTKKEKGDQLTIAIPLHARLFKMRLMTRGRAATFPPELWSVCMCWRTIAWKWWGEISWIITNYMHAARGEYFEPKFGSQYMLEERNCTSMTSLNSWVWIPLCTTSAMAETFTDLGKEQSDHWAIQTKCKNKRAWYLPIARWLLTMQEAILCVIFMFFLQP
jgi:hypothetical protein